MTASLPQLAARIHSIRPVVEKHLGDEDSKAGFRKIQEALIRERPRILVHGAFNAGKSTLINTLIGEERAPAGDIPLTDKVTAYPWDSADLLDTPGVNAPIEHENITQAALREVRLVLFVIRQGDQDAADVYQRLFELLRDGKQIFIILNHEAPDDAARQQVYQRLTELLVRQAPAYGLTPEELADMPVHLVNLSTAWRGRTKGVDALISHSGFRDLEQALRDWILAHNSERDRVAHVAQQIRTFWIEPALEKISTQQQNPALESLQTRRAELLGEKALMESDLEVFINAGIRKRRKTLLDAFASCGRSQTACTECFHDAAEAVADELAAEMNAWLTGQLQQATALNADFSIEIDDLQQEGGFEIPPALRDSLKRLATDKTVLKNALLQMREWKIPGIKGRWEKTLDKWAGRASHAITVVFTLWEVYTSVKAQEEANQREMAIAKELAQATNEVLGNLRKACLEAGLRALEEAYGPLLENVDATLSQITAQLDELGQDQIALRRFLDELQSCVT